MVVCLACRNYPGSPVALCEYNRNHAIKRAADENVTVFAVVLTIVSFNDCERVLASQDCMSETNLVLLKVRLGLGVVPLKVLILHTVMVSSIFGKGGPADVEVYSEMFMKCSIPSTCTKQ
jgi:hypothetical protein